MLRPAASARGLAQTSGVTKNILSISFSSKEILKLDYEKTLAAIDKYEDHVQQIKNWLITACGAVLLLGLNEKSVAITMLTFFIAIGFWFVALICETHLIGARDHAEELETVIQGHLGSLDAEVMAEDGGKQPADDSKQEPHYTFGLVHSDPELCWRNLYQTAMNGGWHVTAFYALIIIVTSLVVFFGTLFGYLH